MKYSNFRLKMAEAAQSRVQSAMKDFINNIDRMKLRGLEREMHLCAANCCADQMASVEEVHRCAEQCQVNYHYGWVFIDLNLPGPHSACTAIRAIRAGALPGVALQVLLLLCLL